MNHSHSTQITARYLEHFTPNEFRFRWLDATACDPDLSRRGNHLAARIFTLWFESNHARTSYAELHRITAMSRKTLERALPELAERGWISVTHRGSNIEIGLAMSEHGLDLLLEERERRQSFAGRRATNDEWTDRIITRLVTTLELHPEQVERLPQWRLLRAKIRSIVSHMLCYETESKNLSTHSPSRYQHRFRTRPACCCRVPASTSDFTHIFQHVRRAPKMVHRLGSSTQQSPTSQIP